MKKIFSVIFLLLLISSISVSSVSAALVTVNPKGQVIWQVLGDSTIQVKSVAENLTSTNSQISLNNTNGKIELNNIDVTNFKDSLVEVQARGEANDLKIGTNGNAFNIEENGIIAETKFPITIDPIKNELSVTTTSGSRLVSVLPYEAILSLTRAKFINKVNSNKIDLTENVTGELQYQIGGKRDINILNVPASTGEVLKVDEPTWLKVFGFLFS